jgi:TolB-like protein
MPEFLQRLVQRKLMQWCLAYLASAWVLLQVIDFVAEMFGWPGLVSRIALVLLAVGFLIVAVLAWYHGEQGHQRATVPEIVIMVSLLLIGVAAVALMVPEPGGETRTVAAAADSTTAIQELSLAVLPFANLSEEASNEYFSDGITEEILNTVARLPGLRVSSRTSSFSFKGQQVGLDEIAQRLRVAHVLEGSVRKFGQQVRISAKLIDTRNDRQLWSADYDRDLKDASAVQQEIARAIAEALQLQLGGAVLVAPRTTSPRAHDSYLLGLSFWSRRTRGGISQAVSHFEGAIRDDSLYADAWAGLALAHAIQPTYDWSVNVETTARLAVQAARRALELDSTLAHPHAAIGWVLCQYEWKWDECEAELRRAVDLGPNDAVSHTWLGSVLGRLGRMTEAIESTTEAARLDPLSVYAHQQLGIVQYQRENLETALAELRLANAIEPDNQIVLNYLTRLHLAAGRYDSAKVTVRRLAELSSYAHPEEAVALVDALEAKRMDQARRILSGWTRSSPIADYHRAYFHTIAGDYDGAIQALQRSLARHEPLITILGIDPGLAPLRSDPRVIAILRRINLR